MKTEGISARNIVLDDESTEEELLHLWERLNSDTLTAGQKLAGRIMAAVEAAGIVASDSVKDLCTHLMSLNDKEAEEAENLLSFVRLTAAANPERDILQGEEILVEFSQYLIGQRVKQGLSAR